MATPVEVGTGCAQLLLPLISDLFAQEFESSLKLVVTAKRLSQSKMAALTELALKNMKVRTSVMSTTLQ